MARLACATLASSYVGMLKPLTPLPKYAPPPSARPATKVHQGGISLAAKALMTSHAGYG